MNTVLSLLSFSFYTSSVHDSIHDQDTNSIGQDWVVIEDPNQHQPEPALEVDISPTLVNTFVNPEQKCISPSRRKTRTNSIHPLLAELKDTELKLSKLSKKRPLGNIQNQYRQSTGFKNK